LASRIGNDDFLSGKLRPQPINALTPSSSGCVDHLAACSPRRRTCGRRRLAAAAHNQRRFGQAKREERFAAEAARAKASAKASSVSGRTGSAR
jgi:hypothetical protein